VAKKAIKILFYLFYLGVFVIFLLEFTLRAAQGFFFAAPDYLQVDEEFATTLRPNLHHYVGIGKHRNLLHHNTIGLRGEEVREDKPELRIFMIGDSYTYGWGTNNSGTMAVQLEESLRKDGIDAEVLNLGVGGYSTTQTYMRFKRFQHLKPDIVVYMFCENDPEDNLAFLRGEKVPHSPEHHRNWLRIILRRHSLLYSSITRKQLLMGKRVDWDKQEKTSAEVVHSKNKPYKPYKLNSELTFAYTDSIASLTSTLGAKFYIGFIGHYLNELIAENEVHFSSKNYYYANQFSEKGYNIIPPPQGLLKYEGNTKILRGDVPFMGHFNSEGYQLWSNSIYQEIKPVVDGIQ